MPFDNIKRQLGLIPQEDPINNPPSTVDEALGVDALGEFKRKISGVESSFGEDLEHPVVEKGIQAGDKAIGEYAMMPNTIQEFARRMGNRKLASLPKELYPDYLEKNPKVQDEITNAALEHVFNRFNKDPEKAAYGWNQGHNLNPDSITKEKLDNSNYIEKFRNIKSKVK